ncbi:MAG: hypothetical protein HW401_870 [Parcubacteria group bacterium]|nr:hypothetical protein [Parcubacteria group bacterium]
MGRKWFEVYGDVDNLNNNIFEKLKNEEVSSKKRVKVKSRYIDLDNTTGFLRALVQVESE